MSAGPRDLDVAIVGMAGRFPGARDVAALWRNLLGGVDSVRRLPPEEIARWWPEGAWRHPDFVPVGATLDDFDCFDAPFFDVTPRDARLLDPQQRLLLECAWSALEDAGYDPLAAPGLVSVYVGVGVNGYMLSRRVELSDPGDALRALTLSDKDYAATRISHKLNLRGESVTVQTACSTSLVAVHMACQSLLTGQSDLALAGAASLLDAGRPGYLYVEGSTNARDGLCRPFDRSASGTVFGSGAAVVVLKPLRAALQDGDSVYAVIRGSAVNNDGAQKAGFAAPGVPGQAEAVARALAVAEVHPETVGYVEAHGTGTPVGDPIEVEALRRAFGRKTKRRGYCALGSIKGNVGHLDAASGVAGLIKAALAVSRGQIPGTMHFEAPNPALRLDDSPFFVDAATRPWPAGGPRRAGVSSLGVGGTNAHVVLEEAPPPARAGGGARPAAVLVSARSARALEEATARLAEHLRGPGPPLADVGYTLDRGRHAFEYRRAVVARSRDEAALALGGAAVQRAGRPAIAFLFPGQGAQRAGMGRGLYEDVAPFREAIDWCAGRLALDRDLRAALFDDDPDALTATRWAQPALFAIEFALARTLAACGVTPAAMVGHSVGEFAAACLAGVLSPEDALDLVAARGALMQGLEAGAMMAVAASAGEVAPLLPPGVVVAAENAPGACVVAGPPGAVEQLEAALAERAVATRRLRTSHAFHSPMVEPALPALVAAAGRAALRPPRVPYLSNVTGDWVRDEDAVDPAYWGRHLRSPVRFEPAVRELAGGAARVLVEVGPGDALLKLAARCAPGVRERAVAAMPSLRGPGDELSALHECLGRLWALGHPVDWSPLRPHGRRVSLPSYAFARERHWIDPAPAAVAEAPPQAAPAGKAAAYAVGWRGASRAARPAAREERCLVVGGGPLAAGLAAALRAAGREVSTMAGFDAGAAPEAVDRVAIALEPPSSIDAALSEGLYRFAPFVAALGRRGAPLRLDVVTRALYAITGAEACRPEQAFLAAAARVAQQEFAGLTWRAFDVAGDDDFGRLTSELLSDAEDRVVAVRGGRAWVPSFERLAEGRGAAALREDAAYVMVGGFGTIAAALAEEMARRARVALVLTTRDASALGAPRRALLERLRGLGARVLVAEADARDVGSLRRLFTLAEAEFGALAGVLSGAADLADAHFPTLDALTPASAGGHVDTKVRGALALLEAVAGRPCDFCAFHSSIASLFGVPGFAAYAAANAFLDALASAWRGAPRVLSVGWDSWREGALGAGPALDALLAALGADAPHVLVTPTEPEALGRRWLALSAGAAPAAAPPAALGDGAGDEIARAVAEVWRSVLGREPGLSDDFFSLGGDSLLAASLLARMRQRFGPAIALGELLANRTVASQAALVRAARRAPEAAGDVEEGLL